MVRMALVVVLALTAGFFLWPESRPDVHLTYELDLGDAHQGTLIVTLIAEGDLQSSRESDSVFAFGAGLQVLL